MAHRFGDEARRAGVHASVLPWPRNRDISVFLGDCTERLPPLPTAVPLSLYQIGIAAIGLWLIDAALTSDLLATCERFGRYEFLFCTRVRQAGLGVGAGSADHDGDYRPSLPQGGTTISR